MNQTVSVKDALKAWIGDRYDDRDYENYLKMKSIGCPDIFLEYAHKKGGGLIGEKGCVHFDNDTVDKKFLDTILKRKYKPGLIYTRKIKEVYSDDEECDIDMDEDDLLMVPYGDNNEGTIMIIVSW